MWGLHKNVLIVKTKKEWIHLKKQKEMDSFKQTNKKSGVIKKWVH